MERNSHEILGGRAYVFRRDDSHYWYAAAFLNGQNYRHSTKHKDYIFDGDFLLVSEDGANLLARSTPIAFSISGKSWVNTAGNLY